MTKRNILKIINVLLAILLLNQATTGMLHDLLPHSVFEIMHKGGWLMVIAAIAHVYLNWAWVKANLFPGKTKKS